jgi:OOP family OmpA-OmpF porin
MTTGYELYKTIGCPGRGILEAPCVDDAPAKPAAKPAAVAPAKAVDSDGDGVVDALDKCPTTPAGRKVNAQGCELDGDADGIVDALDQCPTTPPGRKVNAQGCELDGDGDGVVDALDQCPTTPAGHKVNAQGCELDGDGDGVVDSVDQCPTTPAGRKVNAQGCELDGDADGVVDALDNCPTTPVGRMVNRQGCELDSDGDGVVDAADQCPATTAGTRVDEQGCDLTKVIKLDGVNFDNDLDTLRPDSMERLDKAIATLKRYPEIKVEVAGHTDSRGTSEHNRDLSDRRARVVMAYFIAHGIAPERLSAKGYGETQPVGNNYLEAGRIQNRRVELRIQN